MDYSAEGTGKEGSELRRAKTGLQERCMVDVFCRARGSYFSRLERGECGTGSANHKFDNTMVILIFETDKGFSEDGKHLK